MAFPVEVSYRVEGTHFAEMNGILDASIDHPNPSCILLLSNPSPSMAESSIIRIPHSHESELKEMDRSPIPRSPVVPISNLNPISPIAMDRTLSSAANLVKLLPSGTVLAFQVLSPSFTNKGYCYTSNKYLIAALILLCVLSCILFSFTDSLIGRDGKLYYGLATKKGLYVFNYEGSEEDKGKVFKDLGKYRIRVLDYVHAFFSVVVFLTITFSDSDVRTCFFESAGKNVQQLLLNLPLGAGFLSSLVFMIFPTLRKGIGYSDAGPKAQ